MPAFVRPNARPNTRPITACVINRNGEQYLEDALGAAVAQADDFAEILLVDDASDDGSVELVGSRFPRVRIVRLAENVGPAAARNAALRDARTELVLLLDNDVRLASDCVARLAAALAADSRAAAAMPAVLYAEEPDMVQYDGAGAHFLGLQILEGADRPLPASPGDTRPIGSLISACILLDRSRIVPFPPFDDSFFIYLEDHDFGVRLRAAGGRLLSVPRAHCYHGRGSAGLSIRSLGRYSRMRVYCLIRNRWQFILKNYSSRTILLLAPLFLVYEAAQLVMVTRKGWIGEWWRAARWILAYRREILGKRRTIQRARTVPDRALLEGGPIPFRRELTGGPAGLAAKRLLDGVAALYWNGVKRLL
ncbi:MAG TPA: glycosyltransferase [Gemmatimonadota bacterium]|nr:glycosyltransferase [Gemmatimonadota bacterium]